MLIVVSVVGIQEIRELLLGLKKEGLTILVASHYAEDIHYLCDTVCEMDRGRLIPNITIS